MKITHRDKIIILITCAIIVSFLCFFLGYQNYLEPKLGDFTCNELKETNGEFYLSLSKSHNAVKYEVFITNQTGEEIFHTESDQEEILLKNLTANFGDTLKFKVVAKNKNGTTKESKNHYDYLWLYSSFVNFNTRYISANNGLGLTLYGYQRGEKYHLKLEYLNQVIYEEQIDSDNILIPYDKIDGYAGRLTAKLYTLDHTLISTYNVYINTPVIGKITLTALDHIERTRWNDIKLFFQGGENATEFQLNVLEEGNLVNTISLAPDTKEYTLPAEYLNEDKNYRFQIKALYNDYEEIAETSEISIFVGQKETTNPVFISHNPTFIKSGTKVTLDTRTPNETIYYTLDGTDPTTQSSVYTKPLTINENTTLKTYAVSYNRYDSPINTYQFQVREKDLVVYLSPSNQYLNYGVSKVGFTNEMQEMNKIADVVERVLKENGVTVYRNRSSGNINAWLSESNYVKSDLHLAIHSNASGRGTARGIEIYVDKETSPALSIATHIYQNLYAIYPGQNVPYTNRGVKYANGSLGEANDAFIPCGTLIEVAYHDNEEDARWIVENRESIGNNIATSIINYYN
jgi:N-acetylmuramoyl-L-alanine amidase